MRQNTQDGRSTGYSILPPDANFSRNTLYSYLSFMLKYYYVSSNSIQKAGDDYENT